MGVIYITMLFCFRTTQRTNGGRGGWQTHPWGVSSCVRFSCSAVAFWIVGAVRGAAPGGPFRGRGVFKKSCKSERKSKYAVKYYFSDVMTTRYGIPCQYNHKIFDFYSIMAYYPAAAARVSLRVGLAVFRQFWVFQWQYLFAAVVGRCIL